MHDTRALRRTAASGLIGARMERDEFALKFLLRNLSRFRACRATDKVIADRLGWNERKVQRVLRRLLDYGEVEVVTTKPELREGRWVRGRTIYFRSPRDLAKGALTVANLARARGKTNRFSDATARGQLQCTPTQFHSWLDAACEAGYLATRCESGKRVIERIGHFPAVDLPNRFCEENWVLSAPLPPPEERILELVTGRKRVTEHGVHFRATTNAELAACTGGSVSYAKKLTKGLIEEGRLYSWRSGGQRYLSTTPPPEAARSQPTPASRSARAILQALVDGPRSVPEVAASLGVSTLPRRAVEKARGSGVTVTRFGHLRVFSLGALPADYVEQVRRRQREAKAARDAERRRLKMLGVDRREAVVINCARGRVEEQFWFGKAPLPDEVPMLTALAGEFTEFVTFERAVAVHKEMRAAGTEADATVLARQCVDRLLNVWLASRPKEAARGEAAAPSAR
jgi:hypothetical protein